MDIRVGQLRKFKQNQFEMSDKIFLICEYVGDFYPQGGQSSAKVQHWKILVDGQISTGWTDAMLKSYSFPIKEVK